MRRTLLALTVLLFLLVAGYAVHRVTQPPQVAIATPTRGPAVEAVYATGVVEPGLEIRIAPRAGGHLVELLVDEGAEVRKGQLLARLEDTDLDAAAAELAAHAAYARSQYERNVKLRASALVSADALEKSRTDLDAADAALRRAREQLGYMRLVAPSAGQITRRDGEVGEYIAVNQVIFHMAGPAPLRITADVDEEDLPRVQPGLPVLIRTDAFPDRVFDGRVEQITPRGDSVARSFRVRIALEGDPPLHIGMTTETNIVLAQRDDALLVPSSAVVDGAVWTIDGGRAARLPVETGVVGTRQTEIRSGLAGDERLIVAPPADIAPGDRFRTAD